MKHIVIFGAGKSSTYLIDYLIHQLRQNDWRLSVLDASHEAAVEKTHNSVGTYAASIDVKNETERQKWIAEADIVISLLPPTLHYLVAADCLQYRKNMLTASYVDSHMKSLEKQIADSGLLFLCEMGLDPGIDHMSAMKILDDLRSQGAQITSFQSHCGGLVAPGSDDNPWRYKISWNPVNIVAAGKAGAVYKRNNEVIHVGYHQLFDSNNVIQVDGLGMLSWYPNRNSLNYLEQYGISDVHTFIRSTLRYPEFVFGWKNLILLDLTNDSKKYETDGMTLQQFFQQHLQQHGFSAWIETQLTAKFRQSKMLLEKLQALLSAEKNVSEEHMKELREFMMVDRQGDLMGVNLDDVKTQAAATVAGQMHEANLAIKQLFFLGMDDNVTRINKGLCSAAEVLQFALENKLALNEGERDMIVMVHDLDYVLDEIKHSVRSSLIIKGEDHVRTAMAKMVGLPLGIATKLILQEKVTLTGLHIPLSRELYEPVMEELKEYGILFENVSA